MKNLFILLFLTAGLSAMSQVAINTDGSDPDNSAMLDVKSIDKGLLIPRVALTGTLDVTTIASPATSLLIYNTATAGTSPDNVTPGYYYWNGTAWTTLANGPWTQNGNDIFSGITGNAGIGTVTPGDKLHLYDSTNLRLMIETPDTYYAGIVTRNAQREFFTGTIGDRWSVFDNYVGGERISVLPNGNVGIENITPTHRLTVSDPSGNNTLRLTGTGATYGEGSKLNFGDGDYVFISEDIDDNLLIKGAQRTAIMGGNVGIATTTPDPSAALDVSSTTKGLLPPRMNTAQRNAIVTPVAGLVIFNTSENVLNVYNGSTWASMMPVPAFECGYSITVNHSTAGGVAPVNKTVDYETVNGIPGESAKCWITSNLGARRQAATVNDASEASAGWYWQFNRRQGYKHDGTTRTPNTAWIGNINEYTDWLSANDPCNIELGSTWRIPTYTEWFNVDNSGNWTDWNGPWNSALKIHAAGFLPYSDGALIVRGTAGYYWSSSQYTANASRYLGFYGLGSSMSNENKADGISVRCIRDN